MTQDQPLITREFAVSIGNDARCIARSMRSAAERFRRAAIAFRVMRQGQERRAARHRPGQARRDGLTARQYRAHKRHLNRQDRALRKAHR